MLVNIIQNTISSFRSALAAAEVITTNLKMWLGFQTSVANQEQVVDGDFPLPNVNWIALDGATIESNGARINNTLTGGVATVKQAISNPSGKTFEFTYDIVATDGSTLVVQQLSNIDLDSTTVGTNRKITFTWDLGIDDLIIKRKSGTTDVTIDNVSLKELTQITPDKSGNNNVGELFTGKALEFDGSNDYVDIDGFTLNSSSTTIAFTIKSSQTAFAYLLDAKPLRFNIRLNQSGNLAIHYNGVDKSFGTTPNDGSFHRVVMVIDGANVNAYIDGVESGSLQTFSSSIDLSSFTEFKIGASYSAGCCFFDGILSDFQIYNAAWTTDDIAYDYANPNKLAIDNPSTSLSVTNLKAYWAMSEGDGLVAYDSGTNLEEEEVVDGDFPTGTTAWTLQNGWSISEGVASINAISLYRRLSQSLNTTIGSTYVIKVNCNSYTSGYIYLRKPIQSGVADTDNRIESVGEFEFTLTITSDNDEIAFANGTLDTILSINNVSVREVTASDHGGLINGAEYVDAQPRIPQLGMQNWSKGSNELLYSSMPSNQVGSGLTWQTFASAPNTITVTGGQTAPDGTSTAYLVNGIGAFYQTNIDTSIRQTRRSVWAKTVSGTGTAKLMTHNSHTNNTFTITNNWQRFDLVPNNSFAEGVFYAADLRGSTTLTQLIVWGPQVQSNNILNDYRPTDANVVPVTTLIPNPTIPTKDIFGNAVRDRLNSFNLDGSGWAEVADADDLDFGTGAFTMECWVKADFESTGSSINVICTLGGEYNDADSASIVIDSTKFSCKVSTQNLVANNHYTIGDWYHVCVTRDGSNLCTLYIDAEAQLDTETTSASITNTSTKLIGRDSLTSRLYKNLISDVRLYKGKALTSDEVENNYNAGLSAHTN